MGRFIGVLLITILLIGNLWAKGAGERVLNIYGWFASIPQGVIAAFEKETGIKVNMDFVDSNEILEAKLLSGNSGYDIVIPTAWPYFARQVPAKLFHHIDKSKLQNYQNIDQAILKRLEKADPQNSYGVPFMWGLVVFGYNPKMLNPAIPQGDRNSWALLYKPENIVHMKGCGAILLDDPTDVIYTMYLYLGYDLADESRETLKKVKEHFKKIRPAIKRFDFSLSAGQLANGEVCIAQQWADHLISADRKHQDPRNHGPMEIVLPREGTLMWIDVMAIPIDAPHVDAAYAFIDFLCRPEISAMITSELYSPTAIPAAKEFLPQEMQDNQLIFPSADYMKKVHMAEVRSLQFQRQLTRAYTVILTGK